jgi:hypothetical protein
VVRGEWGGVTVDQGTEDKETLRLRAGNVPKRRNWSLNDSNAGGGGAEQLYRPLIRSLYIHNYEIYMAVILVLARSIAWFHTLDEES